MTTLFRQALRSGWVRVGAVVLSAMAIGLPIAASAASSSTASESKNTAAFRKEFVSYLTQMQQVGAMLQSSPRGRAALTRLGVKPSTLVRSRDAVQHMTPSELVVLQKAFASVPGWQTHPRDLKAALRRNGFSPNGPVRAFAVGPDCDPGPGSPLGITDWYIAVGVALALEIAHEAIPDDIITSIAQVAAAGLWGIAATAALALESVNGVENECNDAKLEDFTRTQLDVAVSTRATQTSVDAFTATLNNLSTLVNSRLDVAVSTRATQASLNAFHNEFTTNATTVNTKLDGITSSVATANSKLDSLAITVGDQGALALRLQIEADLSEPGNHPVALFEVPASGGGYLDLTRSIVADTIAKMQAAGQGVGNAQAFLAAGDAARAAQDYKGAYADYGKAYRAAAM
jgi:hypothetical protein